MSKRDRNQGEESSDRPPKRPRGEFQPAPVEEIHFAGQLQDFLIFRQDGINQLRNGIASFKSFLESILYHREEDNRARQISILREYLETQRPADPKDLERPFLSQLWQAWSFANQNNNDHLASSICAILALLLKTLSGILDLRDQGNLLCKTVLQHQHLRLVKRCLDAPKHKDFVISPCFRLLIEVTTFDGGVMAREVYEKREQTFDSSSLRRNLGMVKQDISEEEARRRPSIRSLTIRFILALLKYLHEGGKIDILKNKPLCNALFQHLRDDPADLVNELLTTVEQSVLKDAELPRSAKASVLSTQNLERVTEVATRSEEGHAASQKAFGWLTSVCTIPQYGLLRESGWYPPGTASSDVTRSAIFVDLGLDSLEFYDSEEPLNVRNTTLLAWTMGLRAQTDERERELLITCFSSAPELVAAYFADKTMPMDPKLTNTWIGYASLLFEIVRLPVPINFGHDDGKASLPAQTSIMIENILPRPLTQKILVRCLNHGDELITFFAIRLLVLSFQKFASVLEEMRPQSADDKLWKEAAERLHQRFTERCPPMKDIIAAFRQIPDDYEHSLQREAITRLLRLYYEHSPLQALEEQFDVSATLTAALVGSEVPAQRVSVELQALKKLELEHLLAIARHSTGMKWFHKQGGLTYSPIVTLLRMHRKEPLNRQARSLLQHVLAESNVLHDDSYSLEALLASLLELADDSSAWDFLDDCIGRATRKPVKYLDDLDAIARKLELDPSAKRPSILVAVLLEQASFVVAKMDSDGKAKAGWVEILLTLLKSDKVVADILKVIRDLPGWKVPKPKKNIETLLEGVRLPVENLPSKGSHVPAKAAESELEFSKPPAEPQSHPELTRWSLKEIDMAIEDGDVSALILCLCSKHSDIRKQGFAQLNKIKLLLHSSSSFENSSQLALLIGEITETFEQQYYKPDIALPYIAGTFGVRALQVLTEPAHHIYPKLNRYLIRGPEWRVNKMPNYWLSNTILTLPEDDDGYWKEVQWVLDWLVDGLRTAEDIDVLRRGNVFEKVMALWHSPGAASHRFIRERVFEMLFRATCVEGGSNVLVTRSGVLSWLEAVSGSEGGAAKKLRERVLDTCDKGMFEAWSKGASKRKDELDV